MIVDMHEPACSCGKSDYSADSDKWDMASSSAIAFAVNDEMGRARIFPHRTIAKVCLISSLVSPGLVIHPSAVGMEVIDRFGCDRTGWVDGVSAWFAWIGSMAPDERWMVFLLADSSRIGFVFLPIALSKSVLGRARATRRRCSGVLPNHFALEIATRESFFFFDST